MKVFTFNVEEGAVIERQCEKFGWPLLDSTGETMYENTHFRTWDEAHQKLLENCDAAMELMASDYVRAQKELVQYTEKLAKYSSAAVKARRLQQQS